MGKFTDYLGKIINVSLEALTADVKKELKDLKEELEKQNRKIDENEKDRIRWEILDFANSCHNGRNHTQDEFKHIITLNDKYKKLLQNTEDCNGVFEIEYEYVKELYNEKNKTNTFLDPKLIA